METVKSFLGYGSSKENGTSFDRAIQDHKDEIRRAISMRLIGDFFNRKKYDGPDRPQTSTEFMDYLINNGCSQDDFKLLISCLKIERPALASKLESDNNKHEKKKSKKRDKSVPRNDHGGVTNNAPTIPGGCVQQTAKSTSNLQQPLPTDDIPLEVIQDVLDTFKTEISEGLQKTGRVVFLGNDLKKIDNDSKTVLESTACDILQYMEVGNCQLKFYKLINFLNDNHEESLAGNLNMRCYQKNDSYQRNRIEHLQQELIDNKDELDLQETKISGMESKIELMETQYKEKCKELENQKGIVASLGGEKENAAGKLSEALSRITRLTIEIEKKAQELNTSEREKSTIHGKATDLEEKCRRLEEKVSGLSDENRDFLAEQIELKKRNRDLQKKYEGLQKMYHDYKVTQDMKDQETRAKEEAVEKLLTQQASKIEVKDSDIDVLNDKCHRFETELQNMRGIFSQMQSEIKNDSTEDSIDTDAMYGDVLKKCRVKIRDGLTEEMSDQVKDELHTAGYTESFNGYKKCTTPHDKAYFIMEFLGTQGGAAYHTFRLSLERINLSLAMVLAREENRIRDKNQRENLSSYDTKLKKANAEVKRLEAEWNAANERYSKESSDRMVCEQKLKETTIKADSTIKQLRNEIDSLRNSNSSLCTKLEALQQSNMTLQKAIESLNNQVDVLEAERREKDQLCTKLEAHVESLTEERDMKSQIAEEQEGKIESLSEATNNLEEERRNSTEKITMLEEKCNNLEKDNEALQDDLSAKSYEVQEKNTKVLEMGTQLEELQKKMEGQGCQLKAYETDVTMLRAKLAQKSEDLEVCQHERTTLEYENEQLKSEVSNKNDNVLQLTESGDQLQQRIESLTSDLETCNAKKAEHEKIIQQLQIELDGYITVGEFWTNEQERLEEEKYLAVEKEKRMGERLEKMKTRQKELKEKYKQVELQRDTANSEKEDLTQRVDSLEQRESELQEEGSKLTQTLSQANAKVEEWKKTQEEAYLQLEAEKENVEKLQAGNREKEKEINDQHNHIEKLLSDLTTCQDALKEYEEEIKLLKEKGDALETECEHLTSELKKKHTTLEQKTKEAEHLQDENRHIQSQLDSSRATLSSLTVDLQNVKEEKQETTNALEQLGQQTRAEIQQKSVEINQLAESRSSLQSAVAKKDQIIEEETEKRRVVNKNLNEANVRADILQSRLKNTEEEVEQLMQRLKRQNDRLEKSNADHLETTKLMLDKKMTLERLEPEYAECKKEVSRLHEELKTLGERLEDTRKTKNRTEIKVSELETELRKTSMDLEKQNTKDKELSNRNNKLVYELSFYTNAAPCSLVMPGDIHAGGVTALDQMMSGIDRYIRTQKRCVTFRWRKECACRYGEIKANIRIIPCVMRSRPTIDARNTLKNIKPLADNSKAVLLAMNHLASPPIRPIWNQVDIADQRKVFKSVDIMYWQDKNPMFVDTPDNSRAVAALGDLIYQHMGAAR